MIGPRFLLRRLLGGLVVLWAVVTVTFFALRLVPGGPFDSDRVLPEAIQENIARKYHLDKPVFEQYGLYIVGILQGDLGPSFKYIDRDVADIIGEAIWVSFELGGFALLIAILLGVLSGVIAAARQNTGWDTLALFVAGFGISMPSFLLGALLVVLFSHLLQVLPPALWEGPRYIVLPALTLGLAPAALIARLTRSALLEVLQDDYIRTARAKGLGERRVLFLHALRNAIPPVLTLIGPLTAILITGSFIVEKIFAIPGLGKFFITAVTNRDYPLVMGVTLLYTALVVLANILVDIGYSLVDPRVRAA